MPGSRFSIAHACALILSAFCLGWMSRDGAIDFMLAGVFADPAGSGFPLRDQPLLAHIGHTGLRWLAISVWLSALAMAIAAARSAVLRPWRGSLWFFCMTVAVTTATVLMLKRVSPHSCPWDMTAFGGAASWFPSFGETGAAPGPGHCSPAAHAAGGFSLIAGYFALRDRWRALARIALLAALALGSAMSAVQMARGAHFLSHNLWSLWIAWLVGFVGYLVWRHLLRSPPAALSP